MMAVEGTRLRPRHGNVEHHAVGLGGLLFFLVRRQRGHLLGTHMSGYAGWAARRGRDADRLRRPDRQRGHAPSALRVAGDAASVHPYPATAAACL